MTITQELAAAPDSNSFDDIASFEGGGGTASNGSLDDVISQFMSGHGEDNGSSEEETSPSNEESGEETPSSEEGESSSEEEVAEKKEELKEEPSSVEVKTLKASLGDKEYDVPEEAVFKLKVDNKEMEVTLNELKRNYQGKIPLDRHFKENKERQRALEEREAKITANVSVLETQIQSILDTFEKNPYASFEMIAELAGKNPADFLPVYIAQSQKTLEELSRLSDAEAKALMLNKKTEYDRKNIERREKALEDAKKQGETKAEEVAADEYFLKEAVEKNFTNEEIERAVEILKDPRSGVELGKMPLKARAEAIVNYITDVERHFTAIEGAVKNVAPEMINDAALIQEIKRLTDKTFTTSDIEEILLSYLGREKPSSPSPKVKTQSSAGQPTRSSTAGNTTSARTTPSKERVQRDGVNGDSKTYMSIFDIMSDYE